MRVGFLISFIAILGLSLGNVAAAAANAAATKAKKGDKGRQRVLSSEARSKHGQKTSIDFDEADIDGQRRQPAGIAITKKNPDQDYDLINLRLRWHPEMVQSTSNLETGRGR